MQVVHFQKDNVRILTNPPNPESFKGLKNFVVNPDLSEVINVPPHLWKLDRGKIVPLNEAEKRLKISEMKSETSVDLPMGNSLLKAEISRLKRTHLRKMIAVSVFFTLVGSALKPILIYIQGLK